MKGNDTKYFSTKQIARCFDVEAHTVLKWIETKRMHGSKALADNHFQISKDDFLEFSNDHQFKNIEKENELKVLVVDDEIAVSDVLGDFFLSNGYNPIVTNSGFEAARVLFSKDKPCIITLDLTMESISGFDLLKILKNIKTNKSIWTIVISGANEESLKEAINCGADFYLQKPIDLKDLEKIVHKISYKAAA